MKIKNIHLAGGSTSSSFGVLQFNEHGCTEVSEEAAGVLLTVPGFEKCAECACEPKETPKPPKAKKKSVESAESES